MTRSSLPVIGAVLLAATLAAQPQTTRLFVMATDRSGAPIEDLQAADIDVKENGATRPIASFRKGTAPMRVVLLVDDGAAIDGAMRRGMDALIGSLPLDAEAALVTVNGGYALRVAPTLDRKRLSDGIKSLRGEKNGTQVARALMEAEAKLLRDGPERWPVYVVVTADADENTSMVKQPEFDAFSNRLQAVAASVHALVITAGGGTSQSAKVLDAMARNLTSNSGGLLQELSSSRGTSDALAAVSERIARDWKRMSTGYEVAFVHATTASDPSIEIGTAREGITLTPSLRRTP
jgi:hypothetical protein